MVAYLKLMSSNLLELTKCSEQLRKKYDLALINLPSKEAKFGIRKSPCGRGYATYEKWSTKIYKKALVLKNLKQLDSLYKDISAHVSAEVKMRN